MDMVSSVFPVNPGRPAERTTSRMPLPPLGGGLPDLSSKPVGDCFSKVPVPLPQPSFGHLPKPEENEYPLLVRTKDNIIPVRLEEKGSAWRLLSVDNQPQGTLYPNGRYDLTNGKSGTLFENEGLGVRHYQGLPGKLLDGVLNPLSERAINTSPIPRLRQQTGLTGQGVKMMMIAGNNDELRILTDALRSHHVGLSPKVDLTHFRVDPPVSSLQELSMAGFRRYIRRVHMTPIIQAVRGFEEFLALQSRQGPNPYHIFVSPFSFSLNRLCDALLYQAFPALSREANIHESAELRALIRELQDCAPGERYPFLMRLVKEAFDENPAPIAEIEQEYREKAAEVARSNVLIFVTSGRDALLLPEQTSNPAEIPHDSAFNHLAKSPDIVSAAPVRVRPRDRWTPEDYERGEPPGFSPAPASGQGTGILEEGESHNPTLAGPDLLPYLQPATGKDYAIRTISGPAAAAIYVAGIAALMLEANPDLKKNPQKVKEILLAACDNPKGYGLEFVGAGLPNPFKAIRTAKEA